MRYGLAISTLLWLALLLVSSDARADLPPSPDERMMVGRPWIVLGGVGVSGVVRPDSELRIDGSARLGRALSPSIELRLGVDVELRDRHDVSLEAGVALFLPRSFLSRTFVGTELLAGPILRPGATSTFGARASVLWHYRHASSPYRWSGGASHIETDAVPFYIELAAPELTYVAPRGVAIGAALRLGFRF